MFDKLRSAFRRQGSRPVIAVGETRVVGGLTAVAALEARLTDAVSLGNGFPAALAADAFLPGDPNLFRRPVRLHTASGERGVVAAATGTALSGLRTTAFLNASDAERSRDLIARAAARQIPLVIHLTGGGSPRQGIPLTGDHASYHALADTGAVLLMAATVQEALDLTLVAHRVAEAMLVPVVIAMDDRETGLAIQDARIPDDELIRRYLGSPRDTLAAASPAQEQVLGAERRRVPRRHDLGRPDLESPFQDEVGFGLGRAAQHGFHAAHLAQALEQAADALTEETGRALPGVDEFRGRDADVLLLTEGAAYETAMTTVDHLRNQGVKVGAALVRSLAPFPEAQLAKLLDGRRHVMVLERGAPAPDGEAAFVRRVRSVLDRCVENTTAGSDRHPDLPGLTAAGLPRVHSVFFGAGGFPLRVNDIELLCRSAETLSPGPVFLGTAGSATSSDHPKRQVLLDRMLRDDPNATRSGLRSTDAVPRVVPATLVEFHRRNGNGDRTLMRDLASLLHDHAGGTVRGLSDLSWDPRSTGEADRVAHGTDRFADPGHHAPVDAVVWESPLVAARSGAVTHLVDGGAFLLPAANAEDALGDRLVPALRERIAARGIRLYAAVGNPAVGLEAEHLLGATLGMLNAEGKLDLAGRKAATLRGKQLEGVDEAHLNTRLDAFRTGFESIQLLELSAAPERIAARGAKPVPPRLRRVQVPEHRLDSPARFEEQVGAFYRRDETDRLSPDPYLALGTLPARTSCQDIVLGEDMIPAFDPDPCTGCGACWSECPDSAITVSILGAQDLFQSGMSRVRESGENADVLRMALAKLATGMAKTGTSGPAGAMMQTAFDAFLETGKLAEDRKTDLTTAFGRVHALLDRVPLTRTQVFFDKQEKTRRGTGQFLSLAIDPDICRGCALCVQACEPGALTRIRRSQSVVAEAADTTFLVGSLPPTSPATLDRMRDQEELHALAAPMLDQIGNPVLTGGGAGEPGSGERLAARQILATAVDTLRPARNRRAEFVETLEAEVQKRIQSLLTEALPTRDLDALSKGLGSLDSPDVDLAELAARVEPSFGQERVDTQTLERLVASARELGGLKQRLAEGDNGLGRSLLAVVGAPGGASTWMGVFPDNPFAVPVELDATGQAAETARGVWEGQLQSDLEGIRATRRARTLLDQPAEATRTESRLARLAWDDLTQEEREMVSPLFLLGTDDTLAGGGLASLSNLFTAGVPIKVIAFAAPQSGMGGATGLVTPAETSASFHGDLGLVALAHPRVFVLQTSLAHSEMTAKGVADAVTYPGPALVRMYAPSPWRDGYAPDHTVRRAGEAVSTRTFPLFRREGTIHPGPESVDLVLGDNPSPEEDWAEGRRTPGHWAAGEARCADLLSPLPEESQEQPVLLADYVDLAPGEREGCVPVVVDDQQPASLVATEELVRWTTDRLWQWRQLRRMAAAGSGMTNARHEAELAALEQKHAAELDGIRTTVETAMTERLRTRLRGLVTQGTVDRGRDE